MHCWSARRGGGENVLGVTCAGWMGKGGDQLGSTISEGYKAILLIWQGGGGCTVASSGKFSPLSYKCSIFFAFFHFALPISIRFVSFILSGYRFLPFCFHAK